MARIKQCVTRDNATDGVETHPAGILHDMFSGTHFTMQGLNDKVATMRGTRPGDPVADILFNMAFRLVVLDARQRIQTATGIPCFGSPKSANDITCGTPIPSKGFAEITFVDDIAYAMHSSTAEELVSHMQITASCLHDAASERDLASTIKQVRQRQSSNLPELELNQSSTRFGMSVVGIYLWSLSTVLSN